MATLLIVLIVGVLLHARGCVTECNGECHTRCEPTLVEKWFRD